MAMIAYPADDGCPDLGIPLCIDCPLPACRYDMLSKEAHAIVQRRKALPFFLAGMTVNQAAVAMGVSRRTAIRYRVGLRGDGLLPAIPLRLVGQ